MEYKEELERVHATERERRLAELDRGWAEFRNMLKSASSQTVLDITELLARQYALVSTQNAKDHFMTIIHE